MKKHFIFKSSIKKLSLQIWQFFPILVGFDIEIVQPQG